MSDAGVGDPLARPRQGVPASLSQPGILEAADAQDSRTAAWLLSFCMGMPAAFVLRQPMGSKCTKVFEMNEFLDLPDASLHLLAIPEGLSEALVVDVIYRLGGA